MQLDEPGKRERISALVDGQLDRAELAQAIAWMASSDDARAAWHSYHVMGDALRCGDLADCSGDRLFVERLRHRLGQAEQTNVELGIASRPDSQAAQAPLVASQEFMPVSAAGDRSANDALVRWKWLAAVASLTAVAVLAWHSGQIRADPSARLAVVAPVVPSAANAMAPSSEPPVMLRDPRLDELLAAHRQFGGTSALQMPAGFLRNATFDQPGR